jgi:hypothetical protein
MGIIQVNVFYFAVLCPENWNLSFYPMGIGALSLYVNRPGCEADHSSQECVELYLHSPVRLHGVVFFFLTFYLKM